jgi:hypothetical protein
MHFSNEDMEGIYGTVPMVGLRGGLALARNSEFHVGAAYGSDSGDPYYGSTSFRGSHGARIKTLPLELELRFNVLEHPARRFYVGTGLQYLWVSERIPGTGTTDTSGGPTYSGWGWGWKVLAGPEWQLGAGRWAIGAQAALSWRDFNIHWENHRRLVDLSGLTVKAYLAFLPQRGSQELPAAPIWACNERAW